MEFKETLKEVAKEIFKEEYICNGIDIAPAWREGFVTGAKWQDERMYSEEEVLNILHNYRNHFELHRNLEVLPNMFFKWFEQFKKTKDGK